MFLLVLLLQCLTCLTPVQGNFIELGKMVATASPCFTLRLWKNYGCFCGLGSCPEQRAVDCLDSCCARHDACYGEEGGRSYGGLGEISNMETILMGYRWEIIETRGISPCAPGG